MHIFDMRPCLRIKTAHGKKFWADILGPAQNSGGPRTTYDEITGAPSEEFGLCNSEEIEDPTHRLPSFSIIAESHIFLPSSRIRFPSVAELELRLE
ncbi:hypothetical protein CRG98_015467, partial [Punica granatum]